MHEVSFQEGLAKKTIPLPWTANNLESMKKAEILKSLCVNPVAVGLDINGINSPEKTIEIASDYLFCLLHFKIKL